MKDLERTTIERACERLMVEYCHLVDHGQAAKIADLFTEDGVWKGMGALMEGRDQVRAGFEKRQAQTERMSRHVCNNMLVNVIDEENAEGTVYLTLFRHDGEQGRKFSPMDGQPAMVGEYRDRFRNTSDGWRFSHRQIYISFVAQGG